MSKEFVLNEQSTVVSISPKRKWLSIVLDINNILCHCIDKKVMNRMPFVNYLPQRIHSSTVPTIVGLKAIFTWPGLHEFFTAISKFATRVIIWSSMKRSIIKEIVHYFFRGLLQPFEVLGQDSCKKIKIYWGKYLKVISGSNEIFLKNVSKTLFIGTIHIDEENMIIINDSPKKYVCNDRGNCLFLKTWAPLDVANDFLVCILGQWLLQLHTD